MHGLDWLLARLDAPDTARGMALVAHERSGDSASADASRERWRIADTLPLGIVFLDEAGHVRALNDAADDLLSPSDTERDPIVGRSLFEILNGSEADDLVRRYREVLEGTAPSAELKPPNDAPTALRHVVIQLRALRRSEPSVGVAILEDRSTLETERARRRQAERLAGLGEMAAGVAHEINNPLASIQTLAEQLTHETSEPAHKELLGILAEEAARAATIVRRQLELSRDSRTRRSGPVDLNAVVRRVVDLRRYECQSREIKLRLDLGRSISLAAGDEGDILQIVLNLVVNAEDALRGWEPEDGRLIILRTRETSEGIVLTVVDNGPGIPRELLHRLFDPFFTTKSAGSGLGLALARSLVTDHGGALWVESQEALGAAFSLRLPRAQEVVEAEDCPRGFAVVEGADEPRLNGRAEARTPDAGPDSERGLRVLVADDEPVLRLAIRRVLEGRGHEVVTFGDTGTALRHLGDHAVDAILVDAHMPGDGIAMVTELEGAPDTAGRAVLMSGDVRGMPAYESWRSRGRFLSKPFSFDQLVELVERVGVV